MPSLVIASSLAFCAARLAANVGELVRILFCSVIMRWNCSFSSGESMCSVLVIEAEVKLCQKNNYPDSSSYSDELKLSTLLWDARHSHPADSGIQPALLLITIKPAMKERAPGRKKPGKFSITSTCVLQIWRILSFSNLARLT
jgi:hypothetical protein